MATVVIPTPLRKFTNNSKKLTVSGNRVDEVILELTTSFPDLKKYLMDPDGKITGFVNIFVDDDDIRDLNSQQTEVNQKSVISIVPAIAGGADSTLKQVL